MNADIVTRHKVSMRIEFQVHHPQKLNILYPVHSYLVLLFEVVHQMVFDRYVELLQFLYKTRIIKINLNFNILVCQFGKDPYFILNA